MAKTSAKRSSRLAEYQDKRDFRRTSEPSGRTTGSKHGHRFVVQRHRARQRHYDLRLELDGVLVSWAVPKGPTLDPKSRHLAVHVEDHPLEYAEFEGVIPAGEYGAGDVIVWDQGTWEPVDTDDPVRTIEEGNLHFDLHGAKLAGRFVLVRRGQDRSGKRQYLLLHKDDEHAEPGWNPEDHPRSVKSGRTNEDVAADPDATWHSDRPPAEAEERTGKRKNRRQAADASARWKSPTKRQLAALEELGSKGTWHIDGRDVALTNLDKVLFPAGDSAEAVTKRDLIRYYALIAPVMLPYLAGRPLNTHRFPDGVDKQGFWHKEVPAHAPDWVRRWHYDDAEPSETQYYMVPDSVASLVWLANYAAIELHAWTSRADDMYHPTWALFDIDPGSKTSFDDILTLARLHRSALDHLGVDARPKVTGQRGIQIWVPIEPRYSYEQTRHWVESVSRAIGDVVPELVSWAWQKSQRRGRARLDYTQNVINKTLVAPYSPRPKPGAPVSVPLEWDELDDPDLDPGNWTIRTVLDRIAEVGDPLAKIIGKKQKLPSPDAKSIVD